MRGIEVVSLHFVYMLYILICYLGMVRMAQENGSRSVLAQATRVSLFSFCVLIWNPIWWWWFVIDSYIYVHIYIYICYIYIYIYIHLYIYIYVYGLLHLSQDGHATPTRWLAATWLHRCGMYIHVRLIIQFLRKKYFDGLPLEIDTHRHFRTSKLISELMRIFVRK